jgi:putative sugar O-methyltransferase
MSNTRTSFSDDGKYPYIAQQASIDDEVFKTFKTHEWYTPVLEHVGHGDGLIYLEIIKNNYNFLLSNIEKYKTNDNFGGPIKHDYDNFGKMSPTTLRYIKVLGDIVNNFGDLDGLDIVEIGCGYGGQSKIIFDTYNVKSYTFIDLPVVLNLIKIYLSNFNIDVNKLIFKDINQLTDNEKYDLFISNYAYTECSENVRNTYFEKVISKSKMG